MNRRKENRLMNLIMQICLKSQKWMLLLEEWNVLQLGIILFLD